MAESPVANSSPLIVLARAGALELLQVLGAEVIIPSAVAGEGRRRGPSDPTVQALGANAWLRVQETPTIPSEI